MWGQASRAYSRSSTPFEVSSDPSAVRLGRAGGLFAGAPESTQHANCGVRSANKLAWQYHFQHSVLPGDRYHFWGVYKCIVRLIDKLF